MLAIDWHVLQLAIDWHVLQGAKLFYVDNVRSAEKILAAALPTLGEGFRLLSNGAPDSGVKNDAFHVEDRWAKALNWAAALGRAASKLLWHSLISVPNPSFIVSF